MKVKRRKQTAQGPAFGSIASDPTNGAAPPGRQKPPNRPLPTDRIVFPKQIEILRAYATASGSDRTAVTEEDVGKLIGLAASTIVLTRAFFSDVGLLKKGENGYIPSEPVFEFSQAYEWNRETAIRKLASPIAASWFGQHLLPMLKFRPFSEDDAIAELATKVTASTEYRDQLNILLQYLDATGLIVRENGLIRLPQTQGEPPPPSNEEKPSPDRQRESSLDKDVFKQETAAGAVSFNVRVNVDMRELAGWSADRIAALFSGIAQVVAAKKGVEEEN